MKLKSDLGTWRTEIMKETTCPCVTEVSGICKIKSGWLGFNLRKETVECNHKKKTGALKLHVALKMDRNTASNRWGIQSTHAWGHSAGLFQEGTFGWLARELQPLRPGTRGRTDPPDCRVWAASTKGCSILYEHPGFLHRSRLHNHSGPQELRFSLQISKLTFQLIHMIMLCLASRSQSFGNRSP